MEVESRIACSGVSIFHYYTRGYTFRRSNHSTFAGDQCCSCFSFQYCGWHLEGAQSGDLGLGCVVAYYFCITDELSMTRESSNKSLQRREEHLVPLRGPRLLSRRG